MMMMMSACNELGSFRRIVKRDGGLGCSNLSIAVFLRSSDN